MGALLILARSYWKQIAVALAFAMLYSGMQYYKHSAKAYKDETFLLKLNVKSFSDSVDALTGEINVQNARIQSLTTIAETRAKESAVAIARASAAELLAKRDAADIMRRTKPADKTACAAASELFDAEVHK